MRYLTLLVSLFVLTLNSLVAQTAPNFTVSDIEGESHTLYEVLDEGKVVLLDFSTTWCGPCWEVHQSHVLEDLYQAFGPEGLDRLEIFFLESDPDTNMDDLMGLTQGTLGDWITGVPFPIIDLPDETIPNAYNVLGYPTLYWAYKSGDDYVATETIFITELDQATLELFELTSPETGTHLTAVQLEVPNQACDVMSGSLYAVNYGTDAITDLTLQLYADGELIDESAVDTELPYGELIALPFSDVPLSGESVVLEVVAAVADAMPADNGRAATVQLGSFEPTLSITVYADDWANEETDLLILNSAGETVYSETTFPEFEELVIDVELAADDCHQIIFTDSYGDGLGNGYIIVSDAAGAEIYNGGFTGERLQLGVFTGGTVSSTEVPPIDPVATIFPSPVAETLQLNLTTPAATPLTVQVQDMLGRTLQRRALTTAAGSQVFTFDVAGLPQGQYVLRLLAADRAQRFVFVK